MYNAVRRFLTDLHKRHEPVAPAMPANLAKLPAGLVAVSDAAPAPLGMLAAGSKKAQGSQLLAVSQLGLPLAVKTAKLGMPFRLVPAGQFRMGSSPGEANRSDDEQPHRVTLTKAFYAGQYPVTQGEWQSVMGNNPSYFTKAGERAPVESVSWYDCEDFLRKLCTL